MRKWLTRGLVLMLRATVWDVTTYMNLSGESGVVAYRIGDGWIAVTFQGDHEYLYNEERPGREEVDRMIELARMGRGLSTYIAQVVRERYAARLR